MENTVFNRPISEYTKERNLRITTLVALAGIYAFTVGNGHVGLSFAVLTVGLMCGAFFFSRPNVVSHLSTTDEGIKTPLNGVNFVSWDDISEFAGIEGDDKSFLIVELTNPDEWINHKSKLKRRVLALNQSKYGSPIAIPHTSFDSSVREVRD